MATGSSLDGLRIPAMRRQRRTYGVVLLGGGLVALLVVLLGYSGVSGDSSRRVVPIKKDGAAPTPPAPGRSAASPPAPDPSPALPTPKGVVVQTSGYIVPRERIEISPRFSSTVKWIGVSKGDRVKAGDVLVKLEDDEYRWRAQEAEGRVEQMRARLAELEHGTRPEEVAAAEARLRLADAVLKNMQEVLERQRTLKDTNAGSVDSYDTAVREREVAAANVEARRKELELARKGAREEVVAHARAELSAAESSSRIAQTYLGWCTITAPIDGVVLNRSVDPGELVTPQSFGGSGGPSTTFLSMADLGDLQVQIDLSEEFTSKVFLDQRCEVSPLAYPEKRYKGYVFEIAPEAVRAKGTLEVKVQVLGPDKFLTPELSAQVSFMGDRLPDAGADRARRKRRAE